MIRLKPSSGSSDDAVECPLGVAEDMAFLSSGDAGGPLQDGKEFDCLDIDKETLEQVVAFGGMLGDSSLGGFDVEKVERPLRSAALVENAVPEWVDNFFKAKGNTELFALFKAANRLRYEILIDTCAMVVAHRIHTMDPDAFEATFALSREYTPEEEAMVRDMYDFGDDSSE